MQPKSSVLMGLDTYLQFIRILPVMHCPMAAI
jgi:hypothetical protein